MNYISNLILPFIVLYIIIYGYIKKVDIYDTFIIGVKESFGMIKNLYPTLIAMIFAVNLFINSNFLELIFNVFRPIFEFASIPIDILPIAILRPISSSASLAYLNNIFTKYGPDSFIGLLSSIIQGSTDTTFYIISLYYGFIGIKKIRYSLFVGLCADIVGIVSSVIIAKLFFN